MWKTLTVVSMVVSIVSCVVAVQAVRGRDEAVRRAIKQHEAQLIQRYAPMVRGLLTDDPHRVDPLTIADLIHALQAAAQRAAETAPGEVAALEAKLAELQAAAEAQQMSSPVARHSSGTSPSTAGTAPRTRSTNGGVLGNDAPIVATKNQSPTSSLLEGEVVFSAAPVSDGALAGDSDLYLLKLPAQSVTPLTTGAGNDVNPVWSPDGTQIAFASDRDGSWEIYILDRQSNEVVRVTETPARETCITWDQDGSRLAYQADDDHSERPTIWTTDLRTRQARRLVQMSCGLPAWSSDGEWIAFASLPGQHGEGYGLWKVRPDGSDQASLFDAETLQTRAVEPVALAWTPSGDALLVTHTVRTDSEFDFERPMRMSILNPSKPNDPQRIPTQNHVGLGWSPNGEAILTLKIDQKHGRVLNVGLAVVTPDGQERFSYVEDGKWIRHASWRALESRETLAAAPRTAR